MSSSRASRLRSPLAALCAAVLTVATASVVVFVGPQSASAATPSQALSSAYAYGRDRGYHVGIAVLDTQTGKTYHAGDHSGTFASESVVKVMIATRLYLQGRLHGSTAGRVYTMITQSDDQIASDLYGSVGGDHLITWIKQRFGIPYLGSEPRRAGWWGNTHITADGMVALYGKIKKMSYWGNWLINAMSHATKYGSDGFYQWFGLKSANSHAAIKQGWGTDYDNWSAGADENTTGFVNGNRYAIAILARGAAGTYGGPIGSMLTVTARRLLPGGVFPTGEPALTTAGLSRGQTGGGQLMVLHGQNLAGAHHVLFGAVSVRPVRVESDAVLVRTPRHDAGLVRLRVATDHGTTAAAGPWFHFILPPRVSTVSPSHGPAGTRVTVTGTDFIAPVHVLVGRTLVLAQSTDTRSLTFTMPAGVPGTVAVRPNTAFGTASAASPTFTVVASSASPASPAKRPAAPGRGAPASSGASSSGASSSGSVPSGTASPGPSSSPSSPTSAGPSPVPAGSGVPTG